MLTLIVSGEEFYNEETSTFGKTDDVELELEHSLISLSKWESKYQKPFLTSQAKTSEEILDYVRMMVLTPIYPEDVFSRLSNQNIAAINAYLESPESATTFGMMPERRGAGEVITAELIYYWMVAFNIPWQAEFWHLNRLFALIRICNIKNSNPKKMSRNEVSNRYRELNAARKAQHGTSG